MIMAANPSGNDVQKRSSCGAAENRDSIKVRIIQVPANSAPIAAVTSQHASSSKSDSVTHHSTQGPQPTSSTIAVSGLHLSPSLVVVGKASTPVGVNLVSQNVAAPGMAPGLAPGKNVVITVPRSAVSQPVTSTPPQSASPQFPANIQIPAGMVLIRSDSGQLMMVSQQVLSQAQQGQRSFSGQPPRILTQQVSTPLGGKSNDGKVRVIRTAAPPSFQTALAQKNAVVVGVAPRLAAVPGTGSGPEQGKRPHTEADRRADTKVEPVMTVSQETLESVKKCKNFLITLIKLASGDNRSSNMADNVRRLVRNLLEGKLEAEEFTEQLYKELKSTPQPCLVPFLKKSLPAVRWLTADPQLFIQKASSHPPGPPPIKQPAPPSGMTTSQQVRGVASRPASMTSPQPKTDLLTKSGSNQKLLLVQLGKPVPGTSAGKQSADRNTLLSGRSSFKESSGSFREDDDINDVAFMAGVNLGEENARILTSAVGSVVQSCQDQLFLSPHALLSRILHKGQLLGVMEVGPEVVAVVSHATQERLRTLIEKLSVMAEHRTVSLTEDPWHCKVNEVRTQLRFLEETEMLKKKRRDAVEREKLLRLAKSRSQTEDPGLQQLKQRAREMKQLEEAQQQHRDANLTALAAIGPRRRRAADQPSGQVSLLPRGGVQRGPRVMLKDLLMCMEQDPSLRHTLRLYRAML
ncbi:transcription initiation factor TFIID subunit 4-like [Cyprinodon tularosa]|uniref:transcription initiation factor TFIID subunit 4-like n=1 Tax=Cyprinodon tularosa TaxID=77115 RepID=UPI0018E1E47C|nr:transcription initiation factor TFIID subunit 4-like [Cyprinodon tularosa]